MKRGFVIVTIVLLAAAAAGAGWYVYKSRQAGEGGPGDPGAPGAEGAAMMEPAEAVQVAEAREYVWRPTADLVGTVSAIRSVMVRNELAGVVRQVGFESGSIVEPGQVLLKQDETTDRADLDAAQASVRVAQASVAQVDSEIRLAKSELDRLTNVQSNAVAAVDIDRAQSRLDTATAARERVVAEIEQAKARVAQVEARLAKLTITAPFRARAGMRTVHEGQYLAEGVDVVALQEMTDRIYLDFAISQEHAPRVALGTAVMATSELLGPDPFRIEVVAVDASVNRDTRNLRVRAIVDNPGGKLYPGMFVQVRVPIEEPKTFVVIPSMAVKRAAYANSVFVIAPDQTGALRARQRYVTLGASVGEEIIVLEGLSPGEKVAAAGSFKLRDGVLVMNQPPAEASGSAPGAPVQEHAATH